MNCNVCGVNEATIHLTEIVNNQMVEIHLCDTCAQEKGTDFKTHFNLGDLLMGLSSLDQANASSEKRLAKVCPNCGMSYEEFGKSGRLGCSECYEAFAKMLLPLIQRVQRATHHLGKKPTKISRSVRTTYDLRLLQDRLRKSVDSEEFEKAAMLRDEIKRIEDRLKKGKKK
ncbi:MAG: UvrB/UvrC motif-containing protein [Candidatus Omnitrophota bacterium]|nr:UvrB/UvrC motif-containing protein [Candidatus Omnitrophota bacterium]